MAAVENIILLKSVPVPSPLAWYMERGVIRPSQPEGPKRRGKRKLALFPEEAPGEDRIASKGVGVENSQLTYNHLLQDEGIVEGNFLFLSDFYGLF